MHKQSNDRIVWAVPLTAVMLSVVFVGIAPKAAEFQPPPLTATAFSDADCKKVLLELRTWEERIASAFSHSDYLYLERRPFNPIRGTHIQVDRPVVEWHLETARAAAPSTSTDSWAVVNVCMLNLLYIHTPEDTSAMLDLGRSILLEKNLPDFFQRDVHIPAMIRALSPFITSNNPKDNQFAFDAESPSFWKERIAGRQHDWFNETEFEKRPAEEAFVLYMRWCVARNFLSQNPEVAIKFTETILARQNEDAEYLKLVQEKHDWTVRKAAVNGALLPEEIEMLKNICY